MNGTDDQAPQHRVDPTTQRFSRVEAAPEQHENVGRLLTREEQATVDALRAGTALLIVLRGPNTGARFLLDDAEVSSGRGPSSDIFLDDVTVSRKHAVFSRGEDGFTVRDGGSLNGTYVNGERIVAVLLRTGDEVQIGKFRLVFYVGTK